jgi:hypothetical protein
MATWGNSIQPIETGYKGYLFRSRAEARWAVFYDALGVSWLYEPEGFELGDGIRYLPDFWLPRQGCWVEIKPSLQDAEREKVMRLAAHTGVFVFVFSADVGPIGHEGCDLVRTAHYYSPKGDWDGCMAWGECPTCREIQIGHFGGHSVSYSEEDRHRETLCPALTNKQRKAGFYDETPRLKAAYEKARSYRFGGRW